MESPKGVVLQKTPEGTSNPQYVDLLDEDKPIAGQKFACLSFVSPEQIIKQREMFYFENFVKHWDFHKSMEKYAQFLNFISFKYKIDFDKINGDLKEFCESERNNLIQTTCLDEYKTFVDAKETSMNEEFDKRHGFQTNMRGVKVRGVYPTQDEAEMRCKMLRQIDPNHDVYVGQVGLWMPFHPEAYKTGRVEYMEETLNQIMSEKKKNESEAKIEFDKRIMETKEQAVQDNIKKAIESGNKLTQTLNDQGNLVNVASSDGVASKFGIPTDESDVISKDEIHRTIFESNNVVMDKNNDHGLSKVIESNPDVDDESMEISSVD